MTRRTIRNLVRQQLAAEIRIATAGGGRDFWVRRASAVRGDFESNVAFCGARPGGRTPQEMALRLRERIVAAGAWPGEVEAAKGFLNFRMNDAYLQEQIARAGREGARYGAGTTLAGRRINVEFVSADPTGPLSLGAAPGAALGEALCRLLEYQGASVTREFFLNDVETSSTMRLLGESIDALYREHFGQGGEIPEGALRDSFVRGVAQSIIKHEGNRYLSMPAAERAAVFAHQAREAAVELQKSLLHQVGIDFDVWTSESALHREGRVTAVVEKLSERGHVEPRDGAQWLRTTAFGDEVDRPLVRANGAFTYLASDIAYHSLKLERGFDLLVNIWTLQHEPYIARTRAALQAAGFSADVLDVKLIGGARLLSDGEAVTESDGNALTLGSALREIERERLWLFLVGVGWGDGIDVEVEVARRDDESNPAYAALLTASRLATMARAAAPVANGSGAWSDAEREVARLVALWPDEAETAALEHEPQRVARFVGELGAAVRQLAAGDPPTHADLLQAAQTVATNALRSLGVAAREQF